MLIFRSVVALVLATGLPTSLGGGGVGVANDVYANHPRSLAMKGDISGSAFSYNKKINNENKDMKPRVLQDDDPKTLCGHEGFDAASGNVDGNPQGHVLCGHDDFAAKNGDEVVDTTPQGKVLCGHDGFYTASNIVDGTPQGKVLCGHSDFYARTNDEIVDKSPQGNSLCGHDNFYSSNVQNDNTPQGHVLCGHENFYSTQSDSSQVPVLCGHEHFNDNVQNDNSPQGHVLCGHQNFNHNVQNDNTPQGHVLCGHSDFYAKTGDEVVDKSPQGHSLCGHDNFYSSDVQNDNTPQGHVLCGHQNFYNNVQNDKSPQGHVLCGHEHFYDIDQGEASQVPVLCGHEHFYDNVQDDKTPQGHILCGHEHFNDNVQNDNAPQGPVLCGHEHFYDNDKIPKPDDDDDSSDEPGTFSRGPVNNEPPVLCGHEGFYDNPGTVAEAESEGWTYLVASDDTYHLVVFLFTVTVVGYIFSAFGLPALVGEIVVGFLMGPPLADYVPFAEALVVVGELGVILFLIDIGISVDLGLMKQVGANSFIMSVAGCVLTLLVAIGLAHAQGQEWQGAIAVGAALAPSSLRIVSKSLTSGGIIDTPAGQLLTTTCLYDVFFALILFGTFQFLTPDSPNAGDFILPFVSTLGFLVVLGAIALFVFPMVVNNIILPLFGTESGKRSAIFVIMGLIVLAYLPLLRETRAHYLTGAFLVGLCFSQINFAHATFVRNTHQILIWLMRIYFAAVVGFQIPLSYFGDGYVIGWGFILYIPILLKMVSGVLVPKHDDLSTRDKVVASLTMTSRGELGIIIATLAVSSGVLNREIYASVIWAVLLSCITSPIFSMLAISHFNDKQKAALEDSNPITNEANRPEAGKMNLHMHIKINSAIKAAMQDNLRQKMAELGLDVLDHRVTAEERGTKAIVETNIYVKDNRTVTVLPVMDKASEKDSKDDTSGENRDDDSDPKKAAEPSKDDTPSLGKDKNAAAAAAESTKAPFTRTHDDKKVIEDRARDIQAALKDCIGAYSNNNDDDDVVAPVIQISEWNPWASQDAQVTKEISAELSTQYFLDMFDKISSKQDGSADQEALYRALNKAGFNVERDDLEKMVAMVDEDADGLITRSEWKEAVDFALQQNNPILTRRSTKSSGSPAVPTVVETVPKEIIQENKVDTPDVIDKKDTEKKSSTLLTGTWEDTDVPSATGDVSLDKMIDAEGSDKEEKEKDIEGGEAIIKNDEEDANKNKDEAMWA